MKLKEYIKHLQDIVESSSCASELELVYSSDDEGNNYNYSYFVPNVGYMNSDNEFQDEAFGRESLDLNNLKKVVCIN